ncbi:MAG: LytTR family DNA-binding domain-containing protein [Blautia sp.]|nr:LytTR family DNA-binding domain-containing protein [Blautia sp.]
MITNLDKTTQEQLEHFLETFGAPALRSAMNRYSGEHTYYLLQSSKTLRKIPIFSIKYVEIFGHNIVFHTLYGQFEKRGTLREEHEFLKKHNFIKCDQSHLIPVHRIYAVENHQVILSTGDILPLSRSCSAHVKEAFLKNASQSDSL